MPKVSRNNTVAVVVTFNRIELLQECIDALLKTNCDVLVVDNASTDGTSSILKKKYGDKIIYENTGKNLGGAGGFNYGIRKAYELGYKFLWIMDDDCIVHKDSLAQLLKADERLNGNYGFLASKVLWKDGSICKMNIPKRTFGKWLKAEKTNNVTEIAMASFVSLFIKSETIKKYGLPIKDFFIWTDDWEFTRRISRQEKCYFVPESIVTHKSKSNIGADLATEDGERLERFKYLYRNDRVLYRREGLKGTILLRLRIIKHSIKIILSDKSNKKSRFNLMFDALKTGKHYFPEVEYV